jgi:hypothetical protein
VATRPAAELNCFRSNVTRQNNAAIRKTISNQSTILFFVLL